MMLLITPQVQNTVSATAPAALDCPKALTQYSGIKVLKPTKSVERATMDTVSLENSRQLLEPGISASSSALSATAPERRTPGRAAQPHRQRIF